MNVLPVLSFVLPLAGACLAATLPRGAARWVALAALASALALCGSSIVLAWLHGPMTLSLGGWPPPLGIEWIVDPLGALVATLVTAMALAAIGGADPSLAGDHAGRERLFYACALVLVAALVAMLFTADLFNLFVSLELASITAYGMVGAGGPGAPAAALRYLVLGSLGASLYLLGVGYLYVETGALSTSLVHVPLAGGPGTSAATFGATLIVVGLSVKMALVPLHGWMAPAYSAAPAASAALMAPLVTKVAAFVLLRLLFGPLHLAFLPASGELVEGLAWVGAITVVTGGLLALRSDGLRRMLAFSSVSQMGLVAVGLGVSNRPALVGAVFVIIADVVAKCALFLAAAGAERRFGLVRVSELDELRGRAPGLTFVFVVAGLSVVGLPPLCGFFGKWYLLQGALQSHRYILAGVVVLGSLLSAAYVFRVIERLSFASPRPRTAVEADRPEASGVPIALSLLVVVLGLASRPLADLAAATFPGDGGP